ncbi:MAG: hypothetical protein Q9166_006736 [cf. Caloplaca sp. 2 TL-2023]
MPPTDFLYRANIHSHFSIANGRGGSMTKIYTRDSGGSSVLITSPYADTLDAAIAALETDLVIKLREINAEPEKAAETDWVLKPLVQKGGGFRPAMPCLAWAGVNVRVVPREVAENEAKEDEEEIPACGAPADQ